TLAAIAARNEVRVTDRARLVACRTTAEVTAADAVAAWREQLAALGELVLIDDPASDSARAVADERAEAARARLEGARATRSQAQAVATASAEAQARAHARQADVQPRAAT